MKHAAGLERTLGGLLPGREQRNDKALVEANLCVCPFYGRVPPRFQPDPLEGEFVLCVYERIGVRAPDSLGLSLPKPTWRNYDGVVISDLVCFARSSASPHERPETYSNVLICAMTRRISSQHHFRPSPPFRLSSPVKPEATLLCVTIKRVTAQPSNGSYQLRAFWLQLRTPCQNLGNCTPFLSNLRAVWSKRRSRRPNMVYIQDYEQSHKNVRSGTI